MPYLGEWLGWCSPLITILRGTPFMNDSPYRSPNPDETSVPVNVVASSSLGGLAVKLLVFGGLAVVLVALMLPSVRIPREASRRSACYLNLKQIAIALQNYHDQHGAFPPAYTVDENGKRLHSWRTLLLPYLEQGKLYESIDLTRPWDDPVNADATRTKVRAYQCPSVMMPNDKTNYLAVVSPGSCLGPEPRKLEDIRDGASETIMVIEVAADHAVPWMSPEDADESLFLALSAASPSPHSGETKAVFADGNVRIIPSETTTAQRRALVSIAGSDDVGID